MRQIEKFFGLCFIGLKISNLALPQVTMIHSAHLLFLFYVVTSYVLYKVRRIISACYSEKIALYPF